MKTLAAIVLFALVLFVFVARRFPTGTGSKPGSWVASDDSEILAAERQAKSTLPSFLQRLQRPEAGDAEFMLKFRLRSPDATEQIWAEQIIRRNGRLYGRLANDPVNRGHSFDQEVEIAEMDILDWGYRSHGIMHGHFSTRALMPRMPNHVAAHIRQQFGWDAD